MTPSEWAAIFSTVPYSEQGPIIEKEIRKILAEMPVNAPVIGTRELCTRLFGTLEVENKTAYNTGMHRVLKLAENVKGLCERHPTTKFGKPMNKNYWKHLDYDPPIEGGPRESFGAASMGTSTLKDVQKLAAQLIEITHRLDANARRLTALERQVMELYKPPNEDDAPTFSANSLI